MLMPLKPTDNQIMYLRREYDAILYDLGLDFPKELTAQAARMIEDRRAMSAEIKSALNGKVGHPKAKARIQNYFETKGIKINL